jgi:hypothetical protein
MATCNKVSQTRQLEKTGEKFFSMVLEVRSPGPRSKQDWLLLESLRECPFLGLS